MRKFQIKEGSIPLESLTRISHQPFSGWIIECDLAHFFLSGALAVEQGPVDGWIGPARRFRQAWKNTSTYGLPEAKATWIRLTLTRTRAPIFSSRVRTVPDVALANAVPRRPRGRNMIKMFIASSARP